ncbi:Outer membrane protein assembly factor BamA [Prevotella aff. ruminicola Tc2-24]|uniref:Outer membrane protein assembly factor BamA n=1 Tax=Prevotella aff. ruminicola Tc2-24 TaxID=81582 RepID=A0A1I0MPZ6_9BACT|nr:MULTISPECIES: BamA/TamA family outer membrane protein [Prevotella]SEE15742.1 Outer membrane protein assembly factor BamA [Prevotella sp. lc2012]SEV90234.1 Outer membrane protein assembly factor BamA [Prevotella aff. ruminicola Tc2-24]
MKVVRYIPLLLLLASCSMTKNIPDDDQLFVGLTKIVYEDEKNYAEKSYDDHLTTTKEEVEAALATEPNGSLFGSSYISMPWSWHLWVYNKFSGKKSGFAKWMTKSFGKAPVLMSQVNPALRASVASSVLRNNGYFRGHVSYEAVPRKNPKKSKIGYTVRLDSLFTLDSVAYTNFPAEIQALIDSTREERLINRGTPLSVAVLDGERNRISTLLRNNGYYYFNPSYTSYLADTFATADKAQLRLQLADGLDEAVLHRWYVGKIDVLFRKSMRETLTDSISRRFLTIHFNGRRSPIRPSVVLRDLRLRPRQEFSYDRYQESVGKINSTGVFSSTDFQFTQRPGTDTLDLRLSCVFDKPYDFYIEGNAIGRTSGRYGPEAKIGLTKRNAFRAGEKLDINLHGAYEWERGGGSDMSSYQYGADASIEFPRIIAPFYNSDRIRRSQRPGGSRTPDGTRRRRHRFYTTPVTYAKISTDIVRRPKYYKMHVVTGEWTYRWQPSASSRHELSPLTVKYQYMNSHTEKFDSMMQVNPYLIASMSDYFIPKMRYSYTYTSPSSLRHPIRWETTIEEAGNLVSLWDMAGGHSFNEKGKSFFKTPYSQFVKLETDLSKTWSLNTTSQLVGHVNAGVIYAYGNSDYTPFSESFYVGGANSVRAFGVRRIGPGAFDGSVLSRQASYLFQNGDIKFVANLEYRTRLFGDLNGAVFLDAGNVWSFDELWDENDTDGAPVEHTAFKPSRMLDEMALGTGIGLRYDLGFLVIRLDWGLALHCPYDTGKSGYFNVNRFKDAHTLHFAIGYPF